MSSIQSKTIFETFPAAHLGLVMAYSGKDEEIAEMASLFKEGIQGVQNAHGEIYNNFRQHGTLMGRIIYELEHPRPFELIPDSYSMKLQELKKRVINCLLQNELLMQRIWAPVLGGRQIEQLSYHEWNELGRLQVEQLPLNELFMQQIWAPVLDGRKIGELSYPERYELERLLQEKRDQDLVAFSEGLRQFCLFIDNFLQGIDHLAIAEKAERLRSWMRTPEIRAQLEGIQNNVHIDQVLDEFCPPEAIYFLRILLSRVVSLLQKRDVAGVLAFLHEPVLQKCIEWTLREEVVNDILDQIVILGDLQTYLKLKENNVFADLDDKVFDLHLENVASLTQLTVMKAAIELPSIHGVLFLYLLIEQYVFNQDWIAVQELLGHPKIDEFSTRPLPATFLGRFISYLKELRDKCQQGGQPYLASRFQEIIDRRSGQ